MNYKIVLVRIPKYFCSLQLIAFLQIINFALSRPLCTAPAHFLNTQDLYTHPQIIKCYIHIHTSKGSILNYEEIKVPIFLTDLLVGYFGTNNKGFKNDKVTRTITGAHCYSVIVLFDKCYNAEQSWKSVLKHKIHISPNIFAVILNEQCFKPMFKQSYKCSQGGPKTDFGRHLPIILYVTYSTSATPHYREEHGAILEYRLNYFRAEIRTVGELNQYELCLESNVSYQRCDLHNNSPGCFAQAIQLYEQRIQNGKNMKWHTNMMNQEELHDKRMFNLPVKSHQFTHLSLWDATYKFVTADLNVTSDMTHTLWSQRFQDPKILNYVHMPPEFNESIAFSFYPVGLTATYKFITAYNVRQNKTQFEIFTMPLDVSVWLFLLAGATMLSLFFTIATYFTSLSLRGKSQILQSFLIYWIRMISSLAEQSGVESILMNIQNSSVRCLGGKLIAVWLLVSIVLTNGYKGFLKSGFTIPHEYETSVKSIEDLSDFKLYGFIPDSSCHQIFNTADKDMISSQLNSSIRVLHGDVQFCIKMHFQCKLYTDQIALAHKMYGGEMFYEWMRIVQNTFHICSKDLEDVVKMIRISLAQNAKVAFVFREDQFEYYWHRFQKIMKKDSSLKFAHNLGAEDTFLTRRAWIALPNGLNSYHRRWVPRRLKILLESGIYWLLEKWDEIQFSESTGRRVLSAPSQLRNDDPSKAAKALSLAESDICILFYAYGFGIAISMLAFAVEILFCFFNVKFVATYGSYLPGIIQNILFRIS